MMERNIFKKTLSLSLFTQKEQVARWMPWLVGRNDDQNQDGKWRVNRVNDVFLEPTRPLKDSPAARQTKPAQMAMPVPLPSPPPAFPARAAITFQLGGIRGVRSLDAIAPDLPEEQ